MDGLLHVGKDGMKKKTKQWKWWIFAIFAFLIFIILQFIFYFYYVLNYKAVKNSSTCLFNSVNSSIEGLNIPVLQVSPVNVSPTPSP